MDDKEARELIDTYTDMILKISFHIVENQADAEDVCQEVFSKLLFTNKKFNDEEHRKAWIIRVTVNISKNIKTSNWSKKRAELINDIAVYDEHHYGVIEEVMKLPDKYKTPIYLYYYEGYSVKEISTILECRENTILSYLRRGRKKLEARMIGGFEYE